MCDEFIIKYKILVNQIEQIRKFKSDCMQMNSDFWLIPQRYVSLGLSQERVPPVIKSKSID